MTTTDIEHAIELEAPTTAYLSALNQKCRRKLFWLWTWHLMTIITINFSSIKPPPTKIIEKGFRCHHRSLRTIRVSLNSKIGKACCVWDLTQDVNLPINICEKRINLAKQWTWKLVEIKMSHSMHIAYNSSILRLNFYQPINFKEKEFEIIKKIVHWM